MGKRIIHSSSEDLVRRFSPEDPALPKEEEKDPKESLEEAVRRAYQEGFEAGKREGLAQIEGQIQSLKSVLEELLAYKEQIYREAEKDLVELAFTIAEKILNTALEIDRALVMNIVSSAISRMKEVEEMTIFISPEDEPIILERKEDILQGITARVNFVAREDVSRGGCVIQTSMGRIDAMISSQLEEIKAKVIGKGASSR